MIEQSQRHEFWSYLTGEKNQPRPKGLTMQRLAVIKPIALASDLWLEVIGRHGAANRTAREFYESAEAAAGLSRTQFWEAVKAIIRRESAAAEKTAEKQPKRSQAAADNNAGRGKRKSAPKDGRASPNARNGRTGQNSRKRY